MPKKNKKTKKKKTKKKSKNKSKAAKKTKKKSSKKSKAKKSSKKSKAKKSSKKKKSKKSSKKKKSKKSSKKKKSKKSSKKKKSKKSSKKKKAKKKEKQKMITATGKRKSAVARVWLLSPGSGKIKVNGKKVEEFFPNLETRKLVIAPLKTLKKQKDFDWNIKLQGGGFKGQAEAAKLGIARALEKFNADWRKELKDQDFLSRDARVKERKKPGLKRARRAPQWRKR